MGTRRRVISRAQREDAPESTPFQAYVSASMVAAALAFSAATHASWAVDSIPVPPSQRASITVMRSVAETRKFVQKTVDESDAFTEITDADDENSYIEAKFTSNVFGKNVRLKIPMRRYNDMEVAEAGLLAGAAVEFVRVAVTYPLDTIKTRLQRKPAGPTDGEATADPVVPTIAATADARRDGKAPAPLHDAPLLREWWGGLGAALLSSAPQGAVFWAVKDVVRRNLFALLGITSGAGTVVGKYALGGLAWMAAAPPPLAQDLGLDWRGLATVAAVGAGEAAYWLARAPTELAKTTAQSRGDGDGAEPRDRGPLEDGVPGLVRSVTRTYPVLALTDLPVVTMRIWLFLALRSHGAASALALEPGMTSDIALFALANIVANGICNPLEVVRTRLLLQLSGEADTEYAGILDALTTIEREEGVGALFKGVLLRLLWNGLLVGIVLGVQRSYYGGAQGFFLGEVDDLEGAVRSVFAELAMFTSGINHGDLNA